jgi:hypothetical protein
LQQSREQYKSQSSLIDFLVRALADFSMLTQRPSKHGCVSYHLPEEKQRQLPETVIVVGQ